MTSLRDLGLIRYGHDRTFWSYLIMTSWRKALSTALYLARFHGVRYRVYSVRRPAGGYRWFVCPVNGRG